MVAPLNLKVDNCFAGPAMGIYKKKDPWDCSRK